MSIMDIKPDYRAYKKRQLAKKFPSFIKCDKLGKIFIAIDGEVKRKEYDGILALIIAISSMICYIMDSLHIIDIPTWIFIPSLIVITTLFIFLRKRILYKISKFEIIDESKLEPEVRQSLEETEKVNPENNRL